MKERTGELTFKGNALTVLGDQVAVGAKAPDFTLLNTDLGETKLSDSAGKVRLLSVVPSIDTGICDLQSKRFNEELGAFGDKVAGFLISADLPFAQKRWATSCGAATIQALSDHRDMAFGDAYGTHIKELRLEQRSVFVIDGDGVVQYAEYVPEVAQHPEYDKALAKLRELAG